MAAGNPETRRRLAAVLAADVAGSSPPLGPDEGPALPPRSGP